MKHAAPANLVNMDVFGRSRNGVSPTEASRMLHKCRASAMERLSAAVSGVMNKVDDTLFELADKAENNAIQTLYFDAMREVRIRRGNIETEFATLLVEQYNRAVRGERRASADGVALDDALPTLGLVEDDDLEATLAVDGMVSKVRERCELDLSAFDLRMGLLLGDSELKPEQNPLAPEAICGVFREACDQLGSDIQVKLILLKLFDKYAAVLLPQLYTDLNRYLVDNDVLPKIPQARPTRPAASTAPSPQTAVPPGVVPPGVVPQGVVPPGVVPQGVVPQGVVPQGVVPQGVVPQGVVPQGVVPEAAVSGAVPAHTPAGAGDSVLAALHQLVSPSSPATAAAPVTGAPVAVGTLQQLTRLQRGDVEQVPGASVVLDAAQLASGGVNVLHQLKNAPIGEGGGRIDDLTVDIVAMLFDFVLEDREIPDFMKALIGRLQIPILKVAMLDRSVFSKRTHPARRLVNALADAAVGWTDADQANNPVYRKAEAVVHRVLGDFEDDVGLFAELLTEFELFRTEAEHEAEERAKDSVKVIQGKEQLEQAKKLARQEVARRTSSADMPPAVRGFLRQHWADFLTVAHMAQGEAGGQWQSALKLMDRLVWSVQPKSAPEERAQLVQLLPGLLRDLKAGMEIISVDANERATFLAELATLHAGAVSRSDSRPAAGVAPSPVPLASRAANDAESEQAPAPEGIRSAHGEPFADELHYGSQENGADADDMAVEEITLEDIGPAEAAPEDADEYLELAQGLQLGTWIEFSSDDGAAYRARLTWVSSATGMYLFTDCKGIKAGERTPAGLAAEFRRRSANIIKRVPLFDRAVSSLMDGLKGRQDGALPASA